MPAANSEISELARRSLARLLPRLEARFASRGAPQDWTAFRSRLEQQFERLFTILLELYGGHYDFFYHLENLLAALAQSWLDRPAALKAIDQTRLDDPHWFQSSQMLGGVCYVDLFAGDLNGIRARIPYFKELGLTYLHLMPLFRAPEAENDGGYAISSYREVNPSLGTAADLAGLAAELHRSGISLVLDFVFNHTSDEHDWALRAKAGQLEFQEYYRMFPDRTVPDEYELSLREIFPDEHPGAFTYFPEIERWVWTTFHSYQWDLNYANPAVFTAMTSELLALANLGVDVLRLDAVAFIWKKMGTSCENLPEAHRLIQAFTAAVQIAAPALLFKSEAIVHPDDVVRYISAEECQLSYNPLLMALLWEALATRDTRLLTLSMRTRFQIPEACAWVNYVRCHDDIGWTFSDDDAFSLGINGYGHRQFLNAYYTGRFEGSFARGLPFQENPKTGDCRISGTCASLAGLEKALHEETEQEVELAVRRVLLLYGVALTMGGIPLIYLGDELGMLNDYSFRSDPAKAKDSRWVHRPRLDPARLAQRSDPASEAGRIFQGLQRLIGLRKDNPAFSGHECQVIDTGNPHLFAYLRTHQGERVLVVANFGEPPQMLSANLLRLYGLSYTFRDLLTGQPVTAEDRPLKPYEMVFLQSLQG